MINKKKINIPIYLLREEKELSIIDVNLLGYIEYWDGRTSASNGELGEFLNVSRSTVNRSISKLKKLNYIVKTKTVKNKKTLILIKDI